MAQQRETLNMTSLSQTLSTKQTFENIDFWIVGDTPLITHAWSEKARREMLAKQVKATRAGKEARDPQADFVNSLYEMAENIYGFPVSGIKNCILSAAHKDKGIARTTVQAALWLEGDMVRTRPALAGAVCDMPLVRIYGSAPEMREDMVRVGAGLNKTATLAYRGQFRTWAMSIRGKVNSSVLPIDALTFLIQEAGLSAGIGEWRNERRGMFGAFHIATMAEEAEWNAFKAGTGEMPVPYQYKQAAE
jgi:hypothetical protein